MALLLIGSTGNGKSTLGNFLLDPSESHMFGDKTKFQMALSNKPETRDVSYGDFLHKDRTFKVIDTPGLNESPAEDLFHMTSLIMALNDPNLKGVSACLLCIKFNSKIDAQYQATVKYYSRLLPSLFEGNVLIIMTEFMTDDRAEKLRKMRRIDVERVKMNTTNEIKESAELVYNPPLFAIDCLPMDKEERAHSLRVRRAILDYIQSLTPVNTTNLQVEKTSYLKELDDKIVKRMLGEITGYNKRLMEVNKAATKALTRIEYLEREILHVKSDIENTSSELRVKDSEELVVAKTWSITKTSKIFHALDEKFKISSEWKIDNVRMWKNVEAEWNDVQKTDYEVSGSLQGQYMRGLHASVTLETKKQRKYVKEIRDMKKKLKELNQKLTALQDDHRTAHQQHQQYQHELKLLQKYIDERREDIGKFSLTSMSTAEAMRRADELRGIKDKETTV